MPVTYESVLLILLARAELLERCLDFAIVLFGGVVQRVSEPSHGLDAHCERNQPVKICPQQNHLRGPTNLRNLPL